MFSDFLETIVKYHPSKKLKRQPHFFLFKFSKQKGMEGQTSPRKFDT